MSWGPAATFEMRAGEPRRRRADVSLAAASAALPPGAYTTFRTYRGRGVVRFPAHCRRLEESVALQGAPAAIDEGAARRLVASALGATAYPESRLRLTFAPPRLYASVEPFVPPPRVRYEEGVACVTLPLRRQTPLAKDTNFILAAQRTHDALPAGVEEGLLLAEDGSILEGLSSNFLALIDGSLYTDEGRVLPGITRALVLEVAASRLPVVLQAVRWEARARIAEAFITSASRGVMPVVRIDGTPVGSGEVGSGTRAVMEGFADLVHREAEWMG